MNTHWKDWCWTWICNTLVTWCKQLTHCKRPGCWERLRAGEEWGDRGWDSWMASRTQWAWVRVNFSSHFQSFSASGSLHTSHLFASGGQSIGVSDSTSILSMNIQNWFSFRMDGLDLLAVAVTICSDFWVPQNKVCHCFHCFSIYLTWSDGTGCHDPCFLNVEL